MSAGTTQPRRTGSASTPVARSPTSSPSMRTPASSSPPRPSTPSNPADGFINGVHKVLGDVSHRRRRHRRLPRHHRRHQQAARGQGRAARLHHERGLRVHARDRPSGGAGRLRQLLLLGQAPAHRPRRLREDGGRPPRLRGQRDRPFDEEQAVAAARWFKDRGITTRSASASCTPTRTTSTELRMREILRREHPEAIGVDLVRGAPSTASTSGR